MREAWAGNRISDYQLDKGHLDVKEVRPSKDLLDNGSGNAAL